MGLFEIIPMMAEGSRVEVAEQMQVERRDHPLAVVVTQDCDLDWDYKARDGLVAPDKLLTHVLFCDLFPERELRDRSRLGSDLFKRVRQNQDERYHCLTEAPIGSDDSAERVPILFADFKRVFSLPVNFVYHVASGGETVRRCMIPDIYLHDFLHRLYSFLGRVAVPE